MGEDLRMAPLPDMKDSYRWIAEANIRLLVKKMNDLEIPKEDIVSIIDNEQYILVYRKKVVK